MAGEEALAAAAAAAVVAAAAVGGGGGFLRHERCDSLCEQFKEWRSKSVKAGEEEEKRERKKREDVPSGKEDPGEKSVLF